MTVIFALTVGFLPIGASALSLEEALAEALANHPGLQAEERRVGALTRDRNWSFQAFYPSVTVGVGTQRWNETTNHRVLAGLTPQFSGATLTGLVPQIFEPDPNSLAAFGRVEFTLGLSGFATMAAAQAAQAAGLAGLAGQRAELIAGVKKAYYSTLALDLSLGLAVRQEAAAKARYELVEAGRRAGSRSEAETLQARATWTDRMIERYQAESRGIEARDSLALLLGRPSGVSITLEGTINPALEDPGSASGILPQSALAVRPDALALEAQAQALDAQVLGALALAVPQIVVGWSFDPAVNGWMNKSLTDPNQWTQTNGALSVQLQWKLDSFLPGSQFWTLRSDLDDYRAGLRLIQNQTDQQARSEIAKLIRSIRDSLRILPLREQEAADAHRAAQLSQAAFQAGILRIVEVQDADVQAQRAELGLIQERLQLVLAQVDLEKALPQYQEATHAQ